jgi:hypothetical protein
MQRRRGPFLRRLAELGPPVVGERIVPMLENHILPILSHVPGPAAKLLFIYVLLQVMISQSTSVQRAWNATKRLVPHPVHRAVAAVGETSIGGAAWSATLAIRSGADRVFSPIHDVHEQQKQRGVEAADGLTQIKHAIDGVIVAPPAPTVDELMKEVEGSTPPPSRIR